jgi:hypothetical protein
MAKRKPEVSRKALIAAGVRPSSLIPPKRRNWQGFAVLAAAVWLVVITALAVAALARPAGTTEPTATTVADAGSTSPEPATAAPGATTIAAATEITDTTPPTDAATPSATATATTPPTATPVPAIQMDVSAQAAVVPADGRTTTSITAAVHTGEIIEGWTVRFEPSLGMVSPEEVPLLPAEDGSLTVTTAYIPPALESGRAYIDAILHNAEGEPLYAQQVVIEVEHEALQIAWQMSSRDITGDELVYIPSPPLDDEPSPLTFRLLREDGEPVTGTYAVEVSALGGTLGAEDSIDFIVTPGTDPVVDYRPADDADAFGVTATLPDGSTASVQLQPIRPAGEITGRLTPAWIGLAICGEGDDELLPAGALTLQTKVSFEDGDDMDGDTYPLVVSYERLIEPDNPAAMFTRGEDRMPWLPGETLILDVPPGSDGRPTLELMLYDGDAEVAGAGPLDLFAAAPGLARFVVRDYVSAARFDSAAIPVGQRRVRLKMPNTVPEGGARAPIYLTDGTELQFSTERYNWPENDDAAFYTLDQPDAASVRVLVPFWVRATYVTQDTSSIVTLHPADDELDGRTDAVPASISIEWFRGAVNVSGGAVTSVEEMPDLLFAAGDFRVNHFDEIESIRDTPAGIYRVYGAGEASPDALAAWPAACPGDGEPLPEPTEAAPATAAPTATAEPATVPAPTEAPTATAEPTAEPIEPPTATATALVSPSF